MLLEFLGVASLELFPLLDILVGHEIDVSVQLFPVGSGSVQLRLTCVSGSDGVSREMTHKEFDGSSSSSSSPSDSDDAFRSVTCIPHTELQLEVESYNRNAFITNFLKVKNFPCQLQVTLVCARDICRLGSSRDTGGGGGGMSSFRAEVMLGKSICVSSTQSGQVPTWGEQFPFTWQFNCELNLVISLYGVGTRGTGELSFFVCFAC